MRGGGREEGACRPKDARLPAESADSRTEAEADGSADAKVADAR